MNAAGAYAEVPEHPFAYLLHAADESSMIAVLNQIAAIAPWLSDGQLQDLAVGLSRRPADAGSAVRIALTASSQDELAGLASEAMRLLPGLGGPALGTRPGIYVGRGPGGGSESFGGTDPRDAGEVALVIAGQPDDTPDLPQRQLSRMVAVLRWLDDLGVEASAAIGHGIGELAGLVWAGAATAADARTLTALRSAALSAPPESAPGQLGETIRRLSSFKFRPPQRRLISGSTGREVGEPSAIAETLCAELFEARLAACDTGSIAGPAVSAAPSTRPGANGAEQGAPVRARSPLAEAIGTVCDSARLLVLTGRDQNVAAAVAALRPHRGDQREPDSPRSTLIIDGDPADDGSVAHTAAALFAAGVLARPAALYAGRPSRPFDIWREQIFLTQPCEAAAGPSAPERKPDSPVETDAADEGGQPELVNAATTEPAERQVPAGAMVDSPAQAPDSSVVGVAPWIRCYAERTQPTEPPLSAPDDQPWRLHTGGCESLSKKARELFQHDRGASRTLAIIGGLDDAAAREAAVLAASDAIGTGRLVAICQGPATAGLWETLHAEHPVVGVTVIRAPMTEGGLRAATRLAAAEPGVYRELSIGPDGTAAEPVLAILPEPGGGQFPFGPKDVVLVSRGSGAAALVLAQVLACSGAAVAVMGRDHPQRDDAVVGGLEQLRSAGARISYELVDLGDHATLVAAVRRVEARFGPVTAIGHSAGPGQPRVLAELTPAEVEEEVLRQTGPLDRLAAAARTATRGAERAGRLRLIVTSGSVIGRYGMAGEATSALVTGALADLAQRLSAATPGCRALHVDWPAWAGTSLGERADLADRMCRAGFTPMQVTDGSRLLLKLLATDGLPERVAVHGRVGVPAPRSIAAAAVTGPAAVAGSPPGDPPSTRFVERALVHYPGVELVAEARLSLLADPYLGDYMVDGVPVLPPVMALEAMAQAASVLAGASARRICLVRISAPIVLPAGTPGSQTVIRLAALRDGDAITVTLRSDNSGFALEHGRAVFGAAVPDLLGDGRHADARLAGEATGSSEPGGEPVDSAELYGSVFSQDGRFRRLATVRPAGPAGSRGAIGLADDTDELPWFGAVPPARAAIRHRLVLGSAGLNDATLQLVQACVPDRRLVFEGCDQVAFSGREAAGPVTIRAVRSSKAERVPSPRPTARRDVVQDPSCETNAEWTVDAVDCDGSVLIAWRGLRMRDAGPLPQRSAPGEREPQSSSLRDKWVASYHRSEVTAST